MPHKQVPDASGLFNMMRNLGGAVGIALIDTILYGRTSGHAEAIRQRLIAGDVTAAQAIGLDRLPPDVSAAGSLIEQAALATSANEAWALLAGVAVLGLLLIPFASADAAKQCTCRGCGAACFNVHCERKRSNPVLVQPRLCSAPSQELRAALRPGHASAYALILTPSRPASSCVNCQATRPEREPRVVDHSSASRSSSASSSLMPKWPQ